MVEFVRFVSSRVQIVHVLGVHADDDVADTLCGGETLSCIVSDSSATVHGVRSGRSGAGRDECCHTVSRRGIKSDGDSYSLNCSGAFCFGIA